MTITKKLILFLMLVIASNVNAQSKSSNSIIYKDMLIYELQGKVKECKYCFRMDFEDEYTEGRVIKFDNRGKLQTISNTEIKKIERDANNRITQIVIQYDEDLITTSEYKYNTNGKVNVVKDKSQWLNSNASDLIDQKIFTYNSKGFISEITDKDLSGERTDLKSSYTYLSFDSKGNWTERKTLDPRTEEEQYEKRVILYY